MRYSVLTWLVWCGYSVVLHQNVESFWAPLVQTIVAQGSGGFLIHNVPLWFVPCLFVVEIGYFYINKIKDIKFKVIVCAIISALGYCMIEVFTFFPFRLLPWSIEVACATIIFYAVGNVFGSRLKVLIDKLHKSKIIYRCITAIVLFVATTACSLITKHISYGSDRLGNHPVALYVGGFAGVLLIMLISNWINEFNFFSTFLNKLRNYIKWIGKNSFRIMAVHVPIKGFLTVIVAKGFHITTEVVGGNIGYSLIVFVITVAITTIITQIINYGIKTISSRKYE